MTETIVSTNEGAIMPRMPGTGIHLEDENSHGTVRDLLVAGTEIGRDLLYIKELDWAIILWTIVPVALRRIDLVDILVLGVVMYLDDLGLEEDLVPGPTQDKGLLETTTLTHDLDISYQDKSGIAPPSQDVSLKKEEKEDVKVSAGEEVGMKTDQTFPIVRDDPLKGITSEVADQCPTKSHSPTLPSYPQPPPEQKHTFNPPLHSEGPLIDKQTKGHEKLEEEKLSLLPSQHRARSPSPPRHFRQRGPPGPSYARRSRSPPKGPRNQSSMNPRGHITPSAPASSHAPGPRGQRRSFAPQNSLSNTLPQPPTSQTQSPVTPSVSAPVEDMKLPTAQVPEAFKYPLPAIPIKQLPPSLTETLDTEISRLQLQRARLSTDYTNLAKEIRRALHELDTATIDLRAAELRRRLADAQHEKARNGLLGVDHVPTG
ncbi:hypothetical protein C0992_000883 [Termitomyces sp. T32_za158]|nr:hypothetical protein C0992_000883 [Termitomyces sp. T32_za158]